ncbi:MAG TPA: cob(I)yrinic acid a,c-diamide adenosyltransferase [Burkholderiales bacterium]|nr:cob(I)yrinic acid a,c-diamide adenosyltransferase [Burkholderiales bacterium]
MSEDKETSTIESRHRARMQRKKAVIDSKIADADAERGVLLVLTGNGKGKSSSAFGMVARSLGHGMRAAVVQFVKSRSDTGEEGFYSRFPDEISWHVMGAGFTWETQDRSLDEAAAKAAWEIGKGYLADDSFDLVVFDEMTYAFKYGWLDLTEVLAAIAARPRLQSVVVTGRAAPEALTEAADTVTEMGMVKHAFKAGVKAMPGIEF